MNEQTLKRLEFPKVLEIICREVHSTATHDAVFAVRPLESIEAIEERSELIEEVRRISQQGAPVPLRHFDDIRHILRKAQPEGALLDPRDVAMFLPVLGLAEEADALLSPREDLLRLSVLRQSLPGVPGLLPVLERSVDSEGAILDTASPALAALRSRRRRLESAIQRKLEEMMRESGVSVFLHDDFATKRAGRWVIPVRMDAKGQVPGVVHDVSRTGETAFVEPLAIMGLSNELENLVAEERAEEIRILRDLSLRIRVGAPLILTQFDALVLLDMACAMASFADTMAMRPPRVTEEAVIELGGARHPLLFHTMQAAAKEEDLVPLDVSLGERETVMVITGSNAGGKTVAIKTVGLLQIMALCGMPISAKEASRVPFVSDLLVDIGDEQSIESSLSTFAAHIAHLADFIERADSRTLVLIDELGTGTDPAEGSALACAVLMEFRKNGALVFATTHLAEIKGFVHRADGMVNAAMEFDSVTLSPRYRLRVGEPGQSHGLEVARRYGLPARVIDAAGGLLSGGPVDVDALIADLQVKRRSYEEALEDVARREQELVARERKMERLIADAMERQREITAAAYREAGELVADVKRRMFGRLEEIKRAERAAVKERIRIAEEEQKAISGKLAGLEEKAKRTLGIEEIGKGETVFVRSLGYDAEVVEVITEQGRIRVRAGNLEANVPVAEVEERRGRKVVARDEGDLGDVDRAAASRINLVGMRVDEALSRLEPFLNHAVLAGLSEVTVIHGIGKGLLSKAVREHLHRHPLVKAYRWGAQEEGGHGVTLVTLK